MIDEARETAESLICDKDAKFSITANISTDALNYETYTVARLADDDEVKSYKTTNGGAIESEDLGKAVSNIANFTSIDYGILPARETCESDSAEKPANGNFSPNYLTVSR